MKYLYVLFLSLVILLVACGTETAVTADTPAALPSATMALVPTIQPPTVPPEPTATALATATTPPTVTPQPTATPAPTVMSQPAEQRFGYPIGRPDRVPGDGFYIRHSYVAENTWYNPGYWHTGEDWYALDDNTAGALIYAIAAGEVVYVGSNYPGRVVIVRHSVDLYSMYGHLDPAVAVAEGEQVARGALLGTVLARSDDVPDHLHFEVRTFLTTGEVNGAQPRYGFRCGVNCPPGPGYWPISAADHPAAQGWRNPLHVINGRMFRAEAAAPLGTVVVPAVPPGPELTLRAQPDLSAPQTPIPVAPGDRFPLLEITAGPEDASGSSAEAYRLWYRIGLPDGTSAWVQAVISDDFEQGSDGRPATLRFQLLPANSNL